MLPSTRKDAGTKLISNCKPRDFNQVEWVSEARKDQPRNTTSFYTHNRPDPSETTAMSRTTRLGSPRHKMARKWDFMESDLTAADSNNQYHDLHHHNDNQTNTTRTNNARPPPPQRQPDQHNSDKQCTRLKPTTTMEAAPKTTTHYSSSLK